MKNSKNDKQLSGTVAFHHLKSLLPRTVILIWSLYINYMMYNNKFTLFLDT